MTGPAVLLSTQKSIPLFNAWLVKQLLRYYDVATNTWKPWSGDGVRVRISTSPTGHDDAGYPTTLLGPYTMALGEEGLFYYKIEADDLTPVLASYVGSVVYQVVEGAYGTEYYDLTDVQPLLVIDPRAPQT